MENGRQGKVLLRNARLPVQAEKPEGEDKRLGMVERRLNFRDRLLIFKAVGIYFKKKQGATNAEAERLRKMNEILDVEGVENYFEAIDLATNKELIAWKHALEAQINRKPGDPDVPMPGKKPRASKADHRGKDSTFWLPPKIDTLIKDAVQAAQWDPSEVEFATELCKKYQIAIED